MFLKIVTKWRKILNQLFNQLSFSIIIIIITIIIIIIIIIIIFTSHRAFVELFIKTIYTICFIAVCATNPEYNGKYWN